MSLKRLQQPTILNSKGQPIVLNAAEKYHAEWTQRQLNDRFQNALGYESIPPFPLFRIRPHPHRFSCIFVGAGFLLN